MKHNAHHTTDVIPAQAGTHNHWLWWRQRKALFHAYDNNDGSGSMGPRLRGDDDLWVMLPRLPLVNPVL